MRKFAIALLAAAALTLGGGATVATAAEERVITFDPGETSLPIEAAAADWSKNTDIDVVVGACTGPDCVHFRVVDGIPCSWDSAVGGCAYPLADGSCQVDIAPYVNLGYTVDLVTRHEAGHCIFWFGGERVNYHLPESRALMSATHDSATTKGKAGLTSIDRAFTRDLY